MTNTQIRALTVIRSKLYDTNGYRYLYTLKGESNHEYLTVSNEMYPLGASLDCRVEVVHEVNRDINFTKVDNDETSKMTALVDGIIILGISHIKTPRKTRKPIPKSERVKRNLKPASLTTMYKKEERNVYLVTDRTTEQGDQIVRDSLGNEHILTNTNTRYNEGDKITCSVKKFSSMTDGKTSHQCLILYKPRLISIRVKPDQYLTAPEKWSLEVQDLGKHKCGKPFTCSCCGKSFPANAGVRVDLKEIYFCNSCARKIYDPQGRGSHRVYISTPMGNKR